MNDFLMYLGAGLITCSFFLGLAIGIIYSQMAKNKGFRYGAFHIAFSLTFTIGFWMAMVAYSYQFLEGNIATFCALTYSGIFGGLLLLYKFMNRRSRLFLVLINIPHLIFFLLAPLAIWNVIYTFFVYEPELNYRTRDNQ